LKNLACHAVFSWEFLPANGTSGGILVRVRDESFIMSGVSVLKSSVSCMLQDKKSNFCWKLVVVYGSPYEEGKADFIDELHVILASWQGPILIGGDFNLSRFTSDKNNGRISQKWADCFND
jgi:hypothetical protein